MDPLHIRSGLQAGDLGEVVRLHGVCYLAEHRLDATFEAYVADHAAAAVLRGFPGPREGMWIAERDRRVVGCVALTDERDGSGRVRWFLVDPAERGSGLGRRLLGELLHAASHHRYRSLDLITFSELRSAAHLYREAGFRCVESTPERRWGRTLEMQRYVLELDAAIRGAA